MAGLIDYTFESIVIDQLSRSEIKSYNRYILEILHQNLTVEQRARLQRIQIRLNERLLELDKQEFKAEVDKNSKTTNPL